MYGSGLEVMWLARTTVKTSAEISAKITTRTFFPLLSLSVGGFSPLISTELFSLSCSKNWLSVGVHLIITVGPFRGVQFSSSKVARPSRRRCCLNLFNPIRVFQPIFGSSAGRLSRFQWLRRRILQENLSIRFREEHGRKNGQFRDRGCHNRRNP